MKTWKRGKKYFGIDRKHLNDWMSQVELHASQQGVTEEEIPPPVPPHPSDELLADYNHSSVADSAAYLPDQHINFRPLTLAKQTESINLKASKSMDLVQELF
uniref:Partitioning defective 3 B n=1 Tax=Sphaerodactylus townsendi TaxID=933632 RepID=A0ACB8FZU7_9SAUR